MHRQTGFTLLEVLLVLFCMTVVLAVTFPIFVTRLHYSLYEQAVQKFSMTMYEAQYVARELGERTTITIADGNVVTVMSEREGVISEWKLPEGMNIDLSKLNNKIHYTEKGTISKVGTIFIETPLWTKEYTINFTYGRMRER